jgi:hypothetical protein
MSLVSPKGEAPLKVSASLDGHPVPVTLVSQTEKVEVVVDPEIAIAEGQSLEVVLSRGQN